MIILFPAKRKPKPEQALKLASLFPAVAVVGPRQVGKPEMLVEIKYSTTPKRSKGFHIAQEDLQTSHHFIVCPVESGYPLSETVRVLGIHELPMMFEQGALG